MSLKAIIETSLPFFQLDEGIQRGGNRRSSIGANLENVITVTNKGYENRHQGLVKKNQVRSMVKNGRIIFTEKSTVDFDGVLLGVGFVAFDCKTCAEEAWRPAKESIHQLCYLLAGSRMMPREQARFFYIIQFNRPFDRHGRLRVETRTFLVENLEELVRQGKYEPQERDEIRAGTGGILLDYRQKLIASVSS